MPHGMIKRMMGRGGQEAPAEVDLQPDSMAAGEYGQDDAPALLDEAVGALEQLVKFAPEVQVLLARLEALRPKIEAAGPGALPEGELPVEELPGKLA